MMYGGWIIGIILIVILLFALRGGGIFPKNTGGAVEGSAGNTGSSAMETLKNRFAKGEIDKEEFEKRKTELEKAN